jgi:isopenicillin N synthase-like dioxygenase
MTIESTLSTLDLSRFHGTSAQRSAFLAELRDALYGHGFFYLVGHDVDPALIQAVLAASKRFFALPLDEKLKIEMVKSPHFRGYNRAGQEHTRGEPDWREQLDINTEATPFEMARRRRRGGGCKDPISGPMRYPS